MLHLGDSKIAANLFPDFQDRGGIAVKKNHDLPHADGFFNILSNMVRPADQAAAPFTDRPEPLRDIYSPSLHDNEKNSARPEAHGEVNREVSGAAGRAAEQSDKDAASVREKDDSARDARQTSEKKQEAGHQTKKSADTDSNPGARLNHKHKGRKTEDTDARDAFEGLHRMIDVIKARENGETRHSRAIQDDIHDLLKTRHFDRGQLKKQVEALIASAEKMSGGMKPADAAQLTRALAGLKQLLSKMKATPDKNQGNGITLATDTGLQSVKELLARVEFIVESSKGEGARQSPGDGQKGGDIFNFSHARSDMPRSAEAAAARHQQSALFREQLDSIIQNAKVFVKDNRNASFSVRLNPRELGSVNISLDLTEGVVNGRFMVVSQEAKDMLMGNLDQIRQQLHDAGITVGEFHVNVNDQRGKHLDGDPERLPVIPPAEQAAEIESRFAPNARTLDDGHFDVII